MAKSNIFEMGKHILPSMVEGKSKYLLINNLSVSKLVFSVLLYQSTTIQILMAEFPCFAAFVK